MLASFLPPADADRLARAGFHRPAADCPRAGAQCRGQGTAGAGRRLAAREGRRGVRAIAIAGVPNSDDVTYEIANFVDGVADGQRDPRRGQRGVRAAASFRRSPSTSICWRGPAPSRSSDERARRSAGRCCCAPARGRAGSRRRAATCAPCSRRSSRFSSRRTGRPAPRRRSSSTVCRRARPERSRSPAPSASARRNQRSSRASATSRASRAVRACCRSAASAIRRCSTISPR